MRTTRVNTWAGDHRVAPVATELSEKLYAVNDLVLRLFPELSCRQRDFLLVLHFRRLMLIQLLGIDRKGLSPWALTQLERITSRTEQTFMILAKVARRFILPSLLSASQRQLLHVDYLSIPVEALSQ